MQMIKVDKGPDANQIKEVPEGEEAMTPLPGRRRLSTFSVQSNPLVFEDNAPVS